MRIVTVSAVIGAVISAAVIVYFLGYRRSPPASHAEAKSHGGAPSVSVRSAVMEAWVRQNGEQATNSDKSEKLAELEARLKALEAKRERVSVPDDLEADAEPDRKKAARQHAEDERTFARWMDGSLASNRLDYGFSSSASDQFKKNVHQLPGVKVESVECSTRFCRARFAGDDGKPPVLQELFGLPPITKEGFTLTEPDGRVVLYFPRDGESLQNLKGEALAANP